MAWTSPMTFVANEILTADQLNIHLRDNLLETAPAKATATGSIFVGTGPNAITERIPKFAKVAASEGTSSTSYTNLETVGPTVTVTTGARAIIFLSAALSNSANQAQTYMAYEISGATTQAPAAAWALYIDGTSADKTTRKCRILMEEDLNPGENTFTAKYRVGANPGTIGDRFIGVWPI